MNEKVRSQPWFRTTQTVKYNTRSLDKEISVSKIKTLGGRLSVELKTELQTRSPIHLNFTTSFRGRKTSLVFWTFSRHMTSTSKYSAATLTLGGWKLDLNGVLVDTASTSHWKIWTDTCFILWYILHASSYTFLASSPHIHTFSGPLSV